MTARWRRIEWLFSRAATLGPGERDRYLDAECGGDAALRGEVEALLDAGNKAEDYFSDLARRSGLDGLSADATGRRMGAYRLTQPLGHGGMGVVYLAERADRQFEKRVAIKLVPLALWGEEARRRFMLERRILARLEHPNIARLLDGGVSDDVPYLVMEYVEGKPLDVYCEEKRLGIDARLGLFLTVCEAVAYAHRNLVIHRDLKPRNILVTETGNVKLLDFGIAKLAAPRAEDAPTLTRLGSRPLTPAYASPELLKGEDVTTASDVYALGVLLYKLLCGQLPYDLSESNESESIRRICETLPRLPSRSQLTAKAAGLSPERLRRRLSGDLDMIVMKALRKEPERRYATVEQLIDDIGRHLANKPVRARPDTAGYRLSRFFRRHRVGTITTAAVIGLAIASGSLITTYAVRVTRERNQIALERDKARQEAKFLAGIFGNTDPGTTRGKQITAGKLLDRGVLDIEKDLTDQPVLKADLQEQIGAIYSHLSLYKKARLLLGKALAQHEKTYGENSIQTEKNLMELAKVAEKQGDYKTSGRFYRKALSIAGGLDRGRDGPARIRALDGLAYLEVVEGHYQQARTHLDHVLEMKRKRYGTDSASVADTLAGLGALDFQRGFYGLSEAFDRKALDIREHLYGRVHPAVASSLGDMANDLAMEGRYAEARKLMNRVLDMQKKLYHGPQELTAVTLHDLARVLRFEGHVAEAISKERTAIRMGRHLWNEPHPRLGNFYSQLGYMLILQGEYSKARAALGKAKANYVHLMPSNDYRMGIVDYGMARADMGAGNYVRAEKEYRRAVSIYRKAYPHEKWKVGRIESELGDCLRKEKKFAAAKPLLLRGYRVLSIKLGADDGTTQLALRRLVKLYRDTGNASEAAHYRALYAHHASSSASSAGG